jgi:transposase
VLARPSSTRIFVATQVTDLRKSYDGLAALVEGTFERSLVTGDLFVFINRRATQVRILYWDRDGYCIWMKRLESGTFRRAVAADGQPLIEVDAGELMMLLEGIDAKVVKRRKRYRRRDANDSSISSLRS